MFPRTRRCLTGTHARPIVTVRTSKLPAIFRPKPWNHDLIGAALQPVARSASSELQRREKGLELTSDGHRDQVIPAGGEVGIDHAEESVPAKRRVSRTCPETQQMSLGATQSSSSDVQQNNTTRQLTTKKTSAQVARPTHGKSRPQAESRPKAQPFRPKQINWMLLARFLAKIPKAEQPKPRESTKLDRAHVQAYTGSYRPNAWTEAAGAGVHVEVLPERGRRNTTRPAIFSGSQYYESAVRDEHMKMRDIKSTPEHSPDHPSSGIQTSVNSVASFSRFVFRLTNEHVSRTAERDLYGDYNRYAADILSKMFSDSTLSTYASTVALNRALTFLHSHLELFDAANLVFAHGRRMSLVQNITTMNICLGFALRYDMSTIAHSTARDMMEFRIQPNSHTWSMLYSALRTPLERRELVKLMQECDVAMTDIAWSRVASIRLDEQLKKMEDRTEEFDKIAVVFDKVFGSAWLSSRTFNRAVRVCNKRCLNKIAQRLTDLANERGVASTVNAHVFKFARFRSQEDIIGAVNLFVLMQRSQEKVYLKWVIPYIFMTAWDRNKTNVCCLLWIFAATHGLITRTMQHVVRNALCSNAARQAKVETASRRQLKRLAWRRLAARVIAGIGVDDTGQVPEMVRCCPHLNAYFSTDETSAGSTHVIEMLTKWTPDDGVREEQLALARSLVQSDLDAWKTFQPMPLETLAKNLPDALKRDEQWDLHEVVRQDATEVRENTRRALQGVMPQRLGDEWTERVHQIRQSIVRNVTALGLDIKARSKDPLRSCNE